MLQTLPVVAVVLLILLIAWSLAQLLWLVLTPPPPLTVPLSSNSSNATASTNYAGSIATHNLFGVASVSAAASEQQVQEAPETKLNLKLRGVYALEDAGKGYALISNGSNPEELVLVGQKLPGNIELTAVYGDRVILSRSGKLETLRLPPSDATGVSFSPPPMPVAVEMPDPVMPMEMPEAEESGGVDPGEPEGAPEAEATSLGGFRDQMMKNPAKFAELINAAPARENGQFVGYQITTLKSHPLLSQIDLQSGDIVTRINGVDIKSPADGMKALQKLSNSPDVQLTLNRGGQVVEISQSF